MIRKILTYYAERLEEYLSRTHRRASGGIPQPHPPPPRRACHGGDDRQLCGGTPQQDVGGGVRRASVSQWNNT